MNTFNPGVKLSAPRLSARNYDERLLDWLRLRAKGYRSITIGDLHGVSSAQVRAHSNLAMNADLAESGEPASRVLAAYRPVAL